MGERIGAMCCMRFSWLCSIDPAAFDLPCVHVPHHINGKTTSRKFGIPLALARKLHGWIDTPLQGKGPHSDRQWPWKGQP
eukprot:3246832-Amphidinium_carterae.1